MARHGGHSTGPEHLANVEPRASGVDTALSGVGQEFVVRDYLLGPSREDVIERPTRARVVAWEEAIRTTCETLGDSDASDIDAASVTLAQEAEGEVALLCGLVEELAEEYGLQASFKLGTGSFTARFTRRRQGTARGPSQRAILRKR